MKQTITTILLLALLTIVSCTKKETYGEAVPAVTTSVSEILKAPESFKDKKIVIEGKLGDVCPSGCWFDLKDEKALHNQLRIDIAPAGIAIPAQSTGKAKVSGTVKYDGKSVIIYGDGVEL